VAPFAITLTPQMWRLGFWLDLEVSVDESFLSPKIHFCIDLQQGISGLIFIGAAEEVVWCSKRGGAGKKRS
jgi:hypothetical protein